MYICVSVKFSTPISESNIVSYFGHEWDSSSSSSPFFSAENNCDASSRSQTEIWISFSYDGAGKKKNNQIEKQ